MHLEKLRPITENTGIRFVSLQKGDGHEQLGECSFRERFISEQKEVDESYDFLNTASIVKQCDLVITTDTALAHLSGGLGKETWLLLHYAPDWRWGINGESTFWYPQMRLFRQSAKDDWSNVVNQVREELKKRYGEGLN